MTHLPHIRAIFATTAGPRLRCFLNVALLLFLVIGSNGATTGYAMTCASPPEMNLSRLQGTVYGPSGVPVPLILVQVVRDGKLVAQTKTDGHGRFEFKVAPGNFKVHVQFLTSTPLDLDVRVRHTFGGLFHAARLQIVLGLSRTRCSFATTSTKELKRAIKRYQGQLLEKQP